MVAYLQMAINNPPPPTPVTAAAAKSRRPSESMEEASTAASTSIPGCHIRREPLRQRLLVRSKNS